MTSHDLAYIDHDPNILPGVPSHPYSLVSQHARAFGDNHLRAHAQGAQRQVVMR